jgi:hypothetical protein
MAKILPQQQLLLELLVMSGDIATSDADEESILHRTLKECEAANWVKISRFGEGFNKTSITPIGRVAIGRPLPK